MIKGIVNGRPAGNEQGIVTAILQYLVTLGLSPVHHRNTGSIRGRNSAGSLRFGRAQSSINQKGAPDILVSVQGHAVAIEVKSATGSLEKDQREWLDRFQRPPSHGLVVVTRSVDDVEKAVDKIRRGERWLMVLNEKGAGPVGRAIPDTRTLSCPGRPPSVSVPHETRGTIGCSAGPSFSRQDPSSASP